MICCVDGCDSRSTARKMCSRHYKRWVRHGDPLGGSTFRKTGPVIPLEERFWSKVDKSKPCWEWTAGRFRSGYGSFRHEGRMTGAHRVSYELTHGPIPEGMEIDHKCHNILCVRPDHLRMTTKKQNQENHRGALRSSKSGVRGVSWYPRTNRWVVHVSHKTIGYFLTLEEAEAAAVAARNRMHTHNDWDRSASA